MTGPFLPGPCPSCGGGAGGGMLRDAEQQRLCDIQPDNSSVEFLRTYLYDETTGAFISTSDRLPDGTVYVPTGTVGDCDPHANCTPDSNRDLNGNCGPGEAASQPVILADGQAPDSAITNDPSADALCGGTWGPGPDPQPAPFPVIESFRNSTYDEPPFIDQGTAPYPQLTSGGIDPVGDGWLRTSDVNSGTNGVHQVTTPFSNADNTTAGVTFAAHDGTAQGGDGLVFALTDGAEPGGQGAAIGGFGNLGLANWEGGYVGVVLDEYGQTCTDSGTGPNPGPGPFCSNTISIQTIGPNRLAQGPAGVIASATVAPHSINATTRTAPGRLITSVITEAGQTYVSASIDWNDGNGPVQYFNRVNVTPVAGPAPSTFRMAVYGGSGGGLRDIKEFRDLTAQAGGIQDWRAFPITTDPIPACVTQVTVGAEVDVTIVSDTQTAGNADNEVWFWLVNTATNTIIDRAEFSSLPSQVGNAHHLTLSSGLIPVAQLPNIRVYVGAETRDQAGAYGQLWENLDVTVTGSGCPVTPIRTLAISAPCPLPVAIVSGGSGDGGGSAPSVFNAPATFEDAEICATIGGVQQPAFRREVRSPDGSIAFSFIGTDGVPITPDTWTAGPCACGDTELLELCDAGTDPPTPFIRRVTYNCAGEVASAEDVNYTGTPYVPVGLAQRCEPCQAQVLADICVASSSFPGAVLPAVAVKACDGAMSYLNPQTGQPWPGTITVVVCGVPPRLWEEILCDAGNANHQFRRLYTVTALGSTVTYDEEFDSTAYAVVGPVVVCPEAITLAPAAVRDVEVEDLCDATPTAFQRVTVYDGTGAVVSTTNLTYAGAPFVPVGAVGKCAQTTAVRDSEAFILCDSAVTPNRFIRTRVYNDLGAIVSTVDTTLAGAPFVPTGAVGICSTPTVTDFDFTTQILCDANGTPFIQRLTYNSSTGVVTTTTNTTLTGAAFVPVGAVGLCANCCPVVVGNGCVSTGSGFYTAIRNTNGTISLIDSVTGAAVLAANIITCPSDNVVRTLSSQGRLVAPGTPWTPGADVVGTLTSVTFTVLSGTATLVDADGTSSPGLPAGLSSTWNSEDDNILTGPQSITAAAASSIWVHWVQR